jgi:aspartokinase
MYLNQSLLITPMTTISYIVGKIINEKPLLQEAIIEGIVNFANLAENIKDDVRKELKKEVKESAIVMALRRHAEKLEAHHHNNFKIKSDIVLRSGLIDITVQKNTALFEKLEKIHKLVDYAKGDTLNIIHGNFETSIVFTDRYKEKMKELLRSLSIIHIEESLVSLTLNVSQKFIDTPGVLAQITRKLAWDNINIYELISTATEINIIVSKDDAMRCYKSLEEIMNNK